MPDVLLRLEVKEEKLINLEDDVLVDLILLYVVEIEVETYNITISL